MSLKLGLEKGASALRLSLQKRGVTNPPVAEVAFDLDVSGSFDDEHKEGLTQALLTRLVPWGMVFDPDQKLDVFTFSSGTGRAHYVGDITPDSTEGYIAREIINKVPGYGNGTEYGAVLEANLKHFGWTVGSTPAPPKKSLFGGLFANKPTTIGQPAPQPAKKRSLVLFVTDGDNSDKDFTKRILRESEARNDETYFLFIGVSNQGGLFPFLKEIGDMFSNTGLVVIHDLARFIKKPDEEINELLIGAELVEWLKK